MTRFPPHIRYRQIGEMIAQGRTNSEIALELGLKYQSVERLTRQMLLAKGFRNRAEFVADYWRGKAEESLREVRRRWCKCGRAFSLPIELKGKNA